MDTQPQEIAKEQFEYYMDVLPPHFYHRTVKLQCGRTIEAAFGFAEGYDTITAFWREADADGHKYYSAPSVLHTDIFGEFNR